MMKTELHFKNANLWKNESQFPPYQLSKAHINHRRPHINHEGHGRKLGNL